MGITIQSNSTLTVMIHLITLEASWFNVFWFTSLVLDFGLLLLLYSSCVCHHYQQRSTVRIALPCTPRTCLLIIILNNPSPMILKGWTYPRVCPKGKVTEKTEPCINWWTAILLLINNQNWSHRYQQHSHILHFRVINLIRTIMHCFCNYAP